MNFDSVDIDGRLSVSVRDLKSMVVHNKKLNICHDFDLVFSDAVTGQGLSSLDFFNFKQDPIAEIYIYITSILTKQQENIEI